MKKYNFIKLVIKLVITFLSIFIIALSFAKPDANAYVSFISFCNMILSIIGTIISFYKKELNDIRLFAFSLFIWGICFIVENFCTR